LYDVSRKTTTIFIRFLTVRLAHATGYSTRFSPFEFGFRVVTIVRKFAQNKKEKDVWYFFEFKRGCFWFFQHKFFYPFSFESYRVVRDI